MLSRILPSYCTSPCVYYALFAILLDINTRELPNEPGDNLFGVFDLFRNKEAQPESFRAVNIDVVEVIAQMFKRTYDNPIVQNGNNLYKTVNSMF